MPGVPIAIALSWERLEVTDVIVDIAIPANTEPGMGTLTTLRDYA